MNFLVNLVRLDLQKNCLHEIPPSLLTLPILRNLNVSFNFIKKIPTIENWSKYLNIFDIQRNLLTSFPDNVDAAALEYLNLKNNKLEKLPNGVCNIKTLTSLDISGNTEIRELPIQMGNLSRLTDFNIDGLVVSVNL
jgi:Leucine-rich repeat (LRR) protein